MTGVCSGQIYASDSASNPTYSGGWSAGQNGGFGFGAWSFDGTDPTGAPLQSLGTSSGLGTTWSLFNTNSGSGLANAGRSIIGGLQASQTFQAIIQNPVNNAGTYTYRGFDILFTSATDNNGPGVNTAALRLSVFDYFNPSMHWGINDGTGSHSTSLSAMTTGASGMIVDLTLNTATTYTLTLAPQSSPHSPYLTFSGTLASAIDYVDFRDYNTASGGPNDTANNFSISSMEVVPEPSILALVGLGSISFVLWRRRRK